MMHNYSLTYYYRFRHEDETASCVARILFHNRFMTIFQFQTDICGQYQKPDLYAICCYERFCWITNITDQEQAFIDDPYDEDSTAEDLLELDSLDEDSAAELSVIIRKSMNESYISAQYPNLEELIKFPSDNELPF